VLYSVLDGVLGMEGEGPSGGKPRAFGVMMGGTCAAALDWTAARMMGFAPHELPYVRAALRVDGLVPEEIDPGEEWRGYSFPDVDTSSVRFGAGWRTVRRKWFANYSRKMLTSSFVQGRMVTLWNLCAQLPGGGHSVERTRPAAGAEPQPVHTVHVLSRDVPASCRGGSQDLAGLLFQASLRRRRRFAGSALVRPLPCGG
jgi:hypothetical protein